MCIMKCIWSELSLRNMFKLRMAWLDVLKLVRLAMLLTFSGEYPWSCMTEEKVREMRPHESRTPSSYCINRLLKHWFISNTAFINTSLSHPQRPAHRMLCHQHKPRNHQDTHRMCCHQHKPTSLLGHTSRVLSSLDHHQDTDHHKCYH